MELIRYINGEQAGRLPRQPVSNPLLVELLSQARARQLAAHRDRKEGA